MKDIDFDELDKAVNSLMGGVRPKSAKDEDQVNTLSINTTLKDDEKPEYEKLDKVASKIGDEALTPDDEQEKVENLPSLPDSEPEPKPEPEPDTESKVESKPVVDEPPVKSEPPASPAVKRPSTGRFLDMVHPSADMRGSSQSSVSVPSRSTPVASHLPKPSKPPVPSSPAALSQSPFLPDAKVEKRPLGGEPPTGDAEPDEDPVSPPVDTPEPADEIVETTAINNDEKKVDDGSGDEQRPLDPTTFDVEAAMQERKLQSIEAAEATEPAPPKSLQAVESADTGKTVQNIVDEPVTKAGSIYSVEEYHQQVAHPAKQKSGWTIVVIIIVIIVLAAAAAGGAYFMFAKP